MTIIVGKHFEDIHTLRSIKSLLHITSATVRKYDTL